MAPTVPIEFAGQTESRKCFFSQMMGKSQKYTKGHSIGFVPDYRHAIETIGESEGFGSSVRTDTEVTASEDSYARRRKCISLNVDGYDGFSVPMQVLSVSRMSRSEKKDLELKLKIELEQVRILQKKIDSLGSNAAVVLSPSSVIRSCSDGAKKPPLGSFNRLSGVSAQQGKKRAPPGRNGPSNKRNGSGHFQPTVKPAALANTSNSMLMKQCENLLYRLMSHQFGWVFNSPVDVVELNIPDYFTVIKHPMDLGTVKSRIVSGKYSSPLDFAADVRLTFSNAMAYNPPGNDVHVMAETLGKYFEVRWKPIEKKLQVGTEVELKPSGPELETEIITTPVQPVKKKKISPTDSSLKPEAVKRIITVEEKHKLGLELEAHLLELPESIVDFLKEHSQGQTVDDDEIEIDIDALSDDTVVTLRKLLDDYLLEKQKNQAKAEPCEMVLPNESGFSNCSMQPCKGNEPVDEDVDIVGGNDQPVSSFPPVEIEKDAAHKNSKCSNSSSSSSDSGSSSSDSEPGNSSDSEADSVKPSVPPRSPKENLNSRGSLDQKMSEPLGDSEVGNPSLTEVAQAEQDSQSKPVSLGVDDRQEGESAPSGRQVSPEKQYRAAILRRRFVDTILKAREKALEKGEKRDPEKLRLEKEELERRQKEEKARLQAEATAAEEARRKAEQEAAAEAKRMRELEREAARQALQMMEKTVDINENSRFMEDLEMLRAAAHDEEVPNFEEEASPELSQNGLGSFKLQGNPLEKLGLYMKVDDEYEEEEVEPPQSLPEQSNDVEEGEID